MSERRIPPSSSWDRSTRDFSQRDAPPEAFGSLNRDNGQYPEPAASHDLVGEDYSLPTQQATSHQSHHAVNTSARGGSYGCPVYHSPSPSNSDDSMSAHGVNATPPESPANVGTPSTGAPAEQIGQLSLNQRNGSPSSPRGRGMLGAGTIASKRSASHELTRPRGHESQRCHHAANRVRPTQCSPRAITSRGPRRAYHDRQSYCRTSGEDLQRRMIEAKSLVRPFVQSHDRHTKPQHRDSGYDSAPSRQNTGQLAPGTGAVPSMSLSQTIHEDRQQDVGQRRKGLIQLSANSRYPGLILQPDSSPISQEQLGAEVKGIYAGLVMVEAKCVNIDAAQAADPNSQLGPEQWQALIALHRTLLYEHHDFLMATQHPSATQALRGLPTKYSIPARMWKHGIHTFLEVLRHRRPHSQDYMLAFIYLAYQMMALLLETVPSFTDTWIECLGDLARYRMAIEEEKEAHATWGGVAARWYTMASDRHPAIGRLYHHLGILERPSLRKFCLYAKSLSCVIPFPNARDSLSTLCGPIVQDENTIQSSSHSVEARIVTYHALVYSQAEQKLIDMVGDDALQLLQQQLPKLRDIGAYLAITNIAAIFELGSPTNILGQQYALAINRAIQPPRPSMTPGALAEHNNHFSPALSNTSPIPSLVSTTFFWENTFALALRSYRSVEDILPYVHVMLVSLHSLDSLRTRLSNDQTQHHTIDVLVDSGRLAWDALADFLNTLVRSHPISDWIHECARQRAFPAPERSEDVKPLSEDFLIRGLIWAQFYFAPGWFDGQTEDDGRAIESDNTHKARIERVLWLGLYLAIHTKPLHYDVQRKVFSAPNYVPPPMMKPMSSDPAEVEMADCYTEQTSDAPSPRSRSSLAASSSPSSEDGFTFVKMPKPTTTAAAQQPSAHSWANVAAKTSRPTIVGPGKRKSRPDVNTFKVADQNGHVWDGEESTTGYHSAAHHGPGPGIRRSGYLQ